MIFSRRSRAGRHAKVDKADAASISAQERAAPPGEPNRAHESGGTHRAAAGEPEPSPQGPFDFADAPQGDRVDLGSILLPGIDGIEIRLQAGDDGAIQQIVLAHGANALQIGAFAAPRSEGLWDEIRAEIRKSLAAEGAEPKEVPGRWGTELRARVRTQNGFDDLRFVGIDGPRWMVRAVFQGPAAADPALGGPLNDCLANLVVRRDEQARPTREALPLQLPEEALRHLQQPEPEPAQSEFVQVPRRKPSPRPHRD